MTMFSRLPRAVAFLARGALTSVFGNLSLALLSVALGLSLWIFVTDRENPKQQQTFNGAIPVRFVNVPTDLAVASTSESTVQVRVEATKNDIASLAADDFSATVDLGSAQKGQSTVTISVSATRGGISVIGVVPSRVDVSLESVRTKTVPVKVSLIGSPQQGFAAVRQSSDPEQASVTGPESLVALVDSVVAEVNLVGQRVDITDNVDLKPRDARGGEISRVSVSPQRAKVSVQLVQREFSQQFVVSPNVTGAPAPGYNIAAVQSDPQLITLTGPLDILASIDAVRGIATEEISIADARADVVRSVQAALPAGVRVQGSPTIKVTIQVRPARGEATFRVVPQLRNVGAGLAVTQAEPVTVTLSGDTPTLSALTPEAITVIIDAQNLGPGLHAVPLQVTAPAGTTLVRTDPQELGIAITQRQ